MGTARPSGLLDRALTKLTVAVGVRLERAREAIGRAALPAFATAAPELVVVPPFEIRHPERIRLGRAVKLGPNCMLRPVVRYPGAWNAHPDGVHVDQTFDPVLEIGDRVTSTGGLQVTVFSRVVIEEDVMLGVNVLVIDGQHATTRGDMPYMHQGIERVAPVRIGRGSWLGNNAVVLPGVTIGRFVVVGANAVVTTDLPDGAVAIGAPARVVRLWDAANERWRKDNDRPTTAGAPHTIGGG